ncbi:hypothetical protein GJ496_011738 [Pomphorhynchus laevis]|nr:hypothetical protein GJ496_011738 [Pomphorhynchus laevis]
MAHDIISAASGCFSLRIELTLLPSTSEDILCIPHQSSGSQSSESQSSESQSSGSQSSESQSSGSQSSGSQSSGSSNINVSQIKVNNIIPPFVANVSITVNEAFDVVTWRPNLFRLPKCAESTKFVSISAALYESFVLRTSPSDKVFKLTVLLPQLVLQRNGVMPISTRRKILSRRLKMWSNKEYAELLSEARELQLQLRFSKRQQKGAWQIQFTDSMKKGPTTQAMHILRKGSCLQGILDVHSEIDGRKVRDILV